MILLTAENGFLSSLTEGNIVVIVIVVIAAIAGFLLLGRLLHVLVHLSYIMSQASSLFSAAKTASENEHGNQQYGGPPQKSLNDVTRLLLPLIQKDFPDFSWKDFQKQTENCIASVLRAYDRQDVSVLVNASERLRDAVLLDIRDDKDAGLRRHYSDVDIHKTAIADYRNREGRCEIRIDSSLGFRTYKSAENGNPKIRQSEREPYKVETICSATLVHIQDLKKAGSEQKIIAPTCPHCGAVLHSTGEKKCPYCGGAFTEFNLRVWSVEAVKFAER